MQVSFKQRPQAARATTKSSDVTRMMYASRAVPMAARIPMVVSIEVADGRSGSALYSGLYGRLERVKLYAPSVPSHCPLSSADRTALRSRLWTTGHWRSLYGTALGREPKVIGLAPWPWPCISLPRESSAARGQSRARPPPAAQARQPVRAHFSEGVSVACHLVLDVRGLTLFEQVFKV